VTDLSTRKTTALAKRLSLHGLLVSDPMAAIAGLFHSIDSSNGQRVHSYFVIDKKLRLRAMYFGPDPVAGAAGGDRRAQPGPRAPAVGVHEHDGPLIAPPRA
jgi:hypothetical protein